MLKIFGDRIGDSIRRGLPLQLIGNNGVWKEIVPGKNVLEVCRQCKKNSFVTSDNVIEDLALQEPWEVNILSCEGMGRIGILMCKDFLIDDNRKLLCDTLKTTLILVPS